MKKITILLPDLREGGTEKMRLNLAIEWSKSHDVEFLLLSKQGNLLNFIPNNIKVKTLSVKRYREVLLPLIQYVKKEKPDILLAAMWPLTFIAPFATLFNKEHTACVISEHGILSSEYKDKGRLHLFLLKTSAAIGYRVANKRIAVSNGVAKDMALLSHLPVHSINVIYNPAAKQTSNRIASYENPFQKSDGLIISTVGRFKAVKNHSLLIKAFARVRQKLKSKLYIIGDGELKNDYLTLINSLNLQDDVILTGFVADPTAYYMYSDLFVLSSNLEGFGNVLVEAMNEGTPVISTDCESGPREILKNGKYGTLVPVNDVEALTQAMLESLQQKHNTELLKKRAAEFSVEKIANQYIETFKQCAD